MWLDFNDSLKAIRKALAEGDEFELERAVRALEKDILAQVRTLPSNLFTVSSSSSLCPYSPKIAAAEELANQITDPHLRAQMLQKVKAAKKQLADLVQSSPPPPTHTPLVYILSLIFRSLLLRPRSLSLFPLATTPRSKRSLIRCRASTI